MCAVGSIPLLEKAAGGVVVSSEEAVVIKTLGEEDCHSYIDSHDP